MSIDERIRESLERLIHEARSHLEAQVPGLVAEIETEADRVRQAALDEARTTADAEVADAVRGAVAAAQAEDAAKLADALAAARAEAATNLSSALATAQAEAATSLETALATAQAEADSRLAVAVEAVRAEAAGELAKHVASAETRAVEVIKEDVRPGERQQELACTERLLDAVRALDSAGSLTEVLDILTEHVEREAGRAAILLVRGDRLQSWRLAGFGAEGKPAGHIEIPLDEGGLAWQAVQLRQRVATSDLRGTHTERALRGLEFAPLPEDRVGLAVPLLVGGEVVAAVYADDGGEAQPMVPSSWPEATEILTRHAARCLEVLTARKVGELRQTSAGEPPPETETEAAEEMARPAASPDEVPAPDETAPEGDGVGEPASAEQRAQLYARLLISEIKLYHEPLVNEGRREGNLMARLRSEIERARQLYEERIPASIRAQADYFGQELVRTLANGDPGLLGQTT